MASSIEIYMGLNTENRCLFAIPVRFYQLFTINKKTITFLHHNSRAPFVQKVTKVDISCMGLAKIVYACLGLSWLVLA